MGEREKNEAGAAGAHYFQLGGNSHPLWGEGWVPPPSPEPSDSEFLTGHGQDKVLLIFEIKMRLAHIVCINLRLLRVYSHTLPPFVG